MFSFCHPQPDWGSSLNQRFWIPDQAGNDRNKLVQKFQVFGKWKIKKEDYSV